MKRMGSTNTFNPGSEDTFDLDAAIDAMRREDGGTEPSLAVGGIVAGLLAVPLVWLAFEIIRRWAT